MGFRLDKFFAEQDAISAMPDEGVDGYLQRLSTQPPRQMDWTNGPPYAKSSGVRHRSNPSGNRILADNQESSIPEVGNEVRSVVLEHSDDNSHLGQAWISQASILDKQRCPSSSIGYRASSPHPDYASSFSPSNKRKVSSPSDSYPNKRRLLSPDASADFTNAGNTEPHSPILSFTKPETSSKPQKRPVLDQGPQLDLVPVVEDAVYKTSRRAETAAHDSYDPKSFIEEISSIDDPDFTIAETRPPKMKKRAIPSEPSKLMLELKERVARHAATKPRPKTIQLGKTDNVHDVHVAAAPMDDNSSIIHVSSSPSSRAVSPAPTKKHKKPVEPILEKGKQRAKSSTAKKTKKEKPKPVTPFEFAENLRMAGPTGKARRKPFLGGYNIFYTGGDSTFASETTRNRMTLLVRLGGNLISRYNPDVVTHIITEGSPGATLGALGLTKLDQIPEHIPTVKWSWVTLGMSHANRLPKEDMDRKLRDHLFQHAAFSSRIAAGMPIFLSRGKRGRAKSMPEEKELSPISDFTQDRGRASTSTKSTALHSTPNKMMPSPSISPGIPKIGEASSSRVALNHDPLAEFYEKAKVETAQDKGLLSSTSSGEEDSPVKPQPTMPKKSRWTCDNRESAITTCPNQDIIDKLSELMELHKAKPGEENHWRAFAYSKAIRALKHHPLRIKSYEEALALHSVGDKTAKKIVEILETGELRRIGYEKTEDVEVAQLFLGIYGVGRTTAYKWYFAGCRTLDDLRNGEHAVKLTSAQEVGLQFYDDINERMPRSEAEALFKLIEPIALSIDPKLYIRITGSFRRGKATCGDIDILITRPVDDGKTHAGVLPRLLDALRTAGILTEDLATPDDPHDLEATYRGLCRLPHDPKSKRRRIDFLTVPWTSRGAALLYYTGDDIFNRALRFKAGAMGYSLNQRGLYAGIVRDPHDRSVKIGQGHIIASETEEEILSILGVPWQEPQERVRG